MFHVLVAASHEFDIHFGPSSTRINSPADHTIFPSLVHIARCRLCRLDRSKSDEDRERDKGNDRLEHIDRESAKLRGRAKVKNADQLGGVRTTRYLSGTHQEVIEEPTG